MSKSKLDEEIEHCLEALKVMSPDSEGYGIAVKNLKELCEARSKKPAFPIEPEAILMATTNLLGILLIINFEKLNVVTSKAFGLVRKVL